MKKATTFCFSVVFAALASCAFAQADSSSSKSKSGHKGVRAAGDKQAIEGYLQGRLNKLQKMNAAQEAFGRKMNGSWETYWSKVFADRKRFEVRVARNRLDLFESLGSLDSAAHNSAISDYERLQTNLWKSFEDKQKEEMTQFFNKMLAELKDFSVEQEKARQDFMAEASDAWQSQKTAAP